MYWVEKIWELVFFGIEPMVVMELLEQLSQKQQGVECLKVEWEVKIISTEENILKKVYSK